MKILFIRHAKAVKSADFEGDDLDRPLKDKGVAQAKAVFAKYAKIYKNLDLIVSSEAVRSRQSAEILSAAFGGVKVQTSSLINPNSECENYKKLLLSLELNLKRVAIVAHEPDLSSLISSTTTGGGILYIRIKKCACIEVEMGRDIKGELKSFISPKTLKNLKAKDV